MGGVSEVWMGESPPLKSAQARHVKFKKNKKYLSAKGTICPQLRIVGIMFLLLPFSLNSHVVVQLCSAKFVEWKS